MLSFVWVRAGSTIKSRRRMLTSASIRTHIRQKAASFPSRAHYPTGGNAGGAGDV
jgi:hypothetical protein